jgi:hypothetical protein
MTTAFVNLSAAILSSKFSQQQSAFPATFAKGSNIFFVKISTTMLRQCRQ